LDLQFQKPTARHSKSGITRSWQPIRTLTHKSSFFIELLISIEEGVEFVNDILKVFGQGFYLQAMVYKQKCMIYKPNDMEYGLLMADAGQLGMRSTDRTDFRYLCTLF
jgi:hypothetical protein